MDGQMEPHIFARFKRVGIELAFEFCPGDGSKYRGLEIDSELRVNHQKRIKFQNFLRRTNVLRDFQKVMSKSTMIEVLDIRLEIRAMPGRNKLLENADGSLDDRYFMAVDTRAVEMFIESGVMDPLRDLPNVRTALVTVIQPWTDEEQDLEPMYNQMLRELEDGIEDDMRWPLSEDEDEEDENKADEDEADDDSED
jgi:hypothetical protein